MIARSRRLPLAPSRPPEIPIQSPRQTSESERLSASPLGDDRSLAPAADRAFALQLPAPVGAVLDLHPGALADEVGRVQALGDKTLELVLADRLPESISVVTVLRHP